jgi:hypothetical protein
MTQSNRNQVTFYTYIQPPLTHCVDSTGKHAAQMRMFWHDVKLNKNSANILCPEVKPTPSLIPNVNDRTILKYRDIIWNMLPPYMKKEYNRHCFIYLTACQTGQRAHFQNYHQNHSSTEDVFHGALRVIIYVSTQPGSRVNVISLNGKNARSLASEPGLILAFKNNRLFHRGFSGPNSNYINKTRRFVNFHFAKQERVTQVDEYCNSQMNTSS